MAGITCYLCHKRLYACSCDPKHLSVEGVNLRTISHLNHYRQSKESKPDIQGVPLMSNQQGICIDCVEEINTGGICDIRGPLLIDSVFDCLKHTPASNAINVQAEPRDKDKALKDALSKLLEKKAKAQDNYAQADTWTKSTFSNL